MATQNSAVNQDLASDTSIHDYYSLLKPRVMRLVVFTAFVGMITAPVSIHPILGAIAILLIALGAGASGALNMWVDSDIDGIMKRTRARPIPAGKVTPDNTLIFGVFLSVASVVFLGFFANYFAAGLLAFTIFFYVVIYSLGLKRRTPQNIVIGGAAGAFPPVIGWACATGGTALEPWLMFLLIFMWTPPHFWALAIFRNEDYSAAKIPMLPVEKGDRVTRNHIFIYTLLLVPCALSLAFTPVGGWVYLVSALVLNAVFLFLALQLWRENEASAAANQFRKEKYFFGFSILYLFAHFVALLVEKALDILGLSNTYLVLGGFN